MPAREACTVRYRRITWGALGLSEPWSLLFISSIVSGIRSACGAFALVCGLCRMSLGGTHWRCCNSSIEDRIAPKEVGGANWCELCILRDAGFGPVLRGRMVERDKVLGGSVSVISSFHPATCGLKGHGSSLVILQVYPFPILVWHPSAKPLRSYPAPCRLGGASPSPSQNRLGGCRTAIELSVESAIPTFLSFYRKSAPCPSHPPSEDRWTAYYMWRE